MGVDEDLLSLGLRVAIERGAEYAEVRQQTERIEYTYLRNGVSDLTESTFDGGISVRVYLGGAFGFASTSSISRRGVRSAAREAVNMARVSRRLIKAGYRLSDEKLGRDRVVTNARIKFDCVDNKSRVELLKDLDSIIVEVSRNRGAEAVSRTMNVGCGTVEKHVMTSDGGNVYSLTPYCMLNYDYILVRGERSLQRHENLGQTSGWEAAERWVYSGDIREEVENIALVLAKGEAPPREPVDVVVGSEIVGLVCHESAGHPGEADRMMGREGAQAGETYIQPDLMDSLIGSEEVTIVDDPTLPGSFGFYLYDEECVRARERSLIEKGRLRELLHNRYTAPAFATSSNGASRASSYNREPLVRMANTYMKPGDLSLTELIEGVRFGVFIKSYHEWNIDDKRWNQKYVGVESFLIENGRLTKPVFEPVLEVTTRSFFSLVDAVGNDLRFYAGYCGKGDPMQAIPVWFGGPSVRLRNLRVSR
ncbi:MAG: TldD/PmbA family protein [Aigarchaeota archaeon]|nr:TldD/PmbA family protein [Aigarchaeota archaeon]MDW8092159.1 TldD/PmbA family protein [Nitrososphaerota archaeon]